MGRITDIINSMNTINQNNPFQQNGVSAGLIPGTVQYQQENPQKTTLQEIYNQAMSKTTPSWVTALSNAIPSIAQIGALGATKGAFNQGYVADSLERQKQRQQAYNQLLQQQEQNKVKDFVQMAEKQMGIDRADEDRNYTREQTRIKSAYDKMIADRDWQNKQDLQKQAQEQWDKEFGLKEGQFKYAQDKDTRDYKYRTDKDNRDYNENVRQFDVSTGIKKDEMDQKKKEAEEKLKQEKINKALSLVDSFNNAGSIEPSDYLQLRELAKQYPDDFMEYVKDSGNYKESGLLLGFLPWKTAGNKNKFTVKNSIANKDTSGL